MMLSLIALIALSASALHSQDKTDSSPHTVQFVTVDKDVKLEVLDWGGTGRPLVFLAGGGNDAHVFDKFAPKFIATYHVYGITRRGYGASSKPAPTTANYAADRLGDDVLAVIDALKLDRPILVGHSIAGEELSSVGSRHPEKVAGLIYLEAGYPYAYYDRSLGDVQIDQNCLQRELEQLSPLVPPKKSQVQELLQSLPQFEKDLEAIQKRLPANSDTMPVPPITPDIQIGLAAMRGEQKYTEIHVPILAIFASPRDSGPMFKDDPSARAAQDLYLSTVVNAFQAGVPSARVVRIPNATHYIFISNEADVLHEMNAFLATLP
jgi:pimeloyl-ACP methyl ester carboxylesterase